MILQDAALGEVVLLFGVDKQDTAALDGIDNRAGQSAWQSRTAETSAQTAAFCHFRIGIVGSVYHDGAASSLVVDAFFQSVEDERIAVASLIGVPCEVKA